ncbi:hypothetical protein LBMAG26_09170 [Bacteroidota bacterium]|nr:hypothetical protein LBMAG26_09170 [Bacteroidota bacterium]
MFGSFYGAIEFGIAKNKGVMESILDGNLMHLVVDDTDALHLLEQVKPGFAECFEQPMLGCE